MSEILFDEPSPEVGRVILNSGSGNPLTPALLAALAKELGRLAQDTPRALVIDGGDGTIFSGGFSLPVIANWERDEIRGFFADFLDVLYQIMLLPCPTVTALNGHAIAGGFILSLASDMRVVRSGKLKLGLSEVDLGVCVPAGPQVLLAARTSEVHALRLGMLGHLFGAEEALQMGYATQCVDDATGGAVDLAARLALKPGGACAETSRIYTEGLVARVKAADAAYMDAFLDSWFSAEGQHCIQALAAKLSAR